MKRVLISVSDKSGIVEFSKKISELGWEIISTGGTFSVLSENGVDVKEVSDVTGFPEAFEGRVKTLHPKVHGGILYKRDSEEHVKRAKELDIENIDMVVVNLYPFKEVYSDKNSSMEDRIENIDIGGPTLVRAASKNYKFVNIVVDPNDYEDVLSQIERNGQTTESFRLELAKKAFAHTAYYDSMISKYFNELTDDEYPDKLVVSYDKKSDLRYGENPHQRGAFYTDAIEIENGLGNIVQHNGKELSYNNINDTNEGIDIIREFAEPTAVAIKHGNPCGVASAENIEEAFKKAYESDSQSIFGGIVILNREVDKSLAEFLNRIFLEIIVAPAYTDEAIAVLSRKINLRVLEQEDIAVEDSNRKLLKSVKGGLLVQDSNDELANNELEYVTDKKPTEDQIEDLLFAWKIVKGTKSNAVVIAKDKTTVSIGPGQVSRIWALENAIKQGEERVDGSVLASDGFFPFDDCVELSAESGIVSIIQPGGSRNDSESIDMANRKEISMVFTGIRHFKH